MTTIEAIERAVGKPFQEHQLGALDDALEQVRQGAWLRLCLYHRTGAGKTYTALAAVALTGAQHVLVLAPPVTHGAWAKQAAAVGLQITTISHAKFRQAGYKVRRDQAMIVDEFHLLGGQTGKGWKKLDRIAAGLQAPLVIASATPNYNDAERVYCIQHVLDPASVRGGFLQFLYTHCITEENPFGKIPNVRGFRNFADAEEYLKQLPKVHYVEDEMIKQIEISDLEVHLDLPEEMERYGFDRRRGRIYASLMEARHSINRYRLIGDDGLIRPEVYEQVGYAAGLVPTPTLVFANSAEVARAMAATVQDSGASALLITGENTAVYKQATVDQFLTGKYPVLIGTASLATGTDGIDKMCDHLCILDDTDDAALRRQLMGRILPRGLDTDVSAKVVTRIVFP